MNALHLPSFLWGLALAPVIIPTVVFLAFLVVAFVAEAVERAVKG